MVQAATLALVGHPATTTMARAIFHHLSPHLGETGLTGGGAVPFTTLPAMRWHDST